MDKYVWNNCAYFHKHMFPCCCCSLLHMTCSPLVWNICAFNPRASVRIWANQTHTQWLVLKINMIKYSAHYRLVFISGRTECEELREINSKCQTAWCLDYSFIIIS